MKIGKKIEIEILNLKFLTETLEIAEEDLKEGANDLHFRLSHFRKRVANKDKDKYDQFFFGAKMDDVQKIYEGTTDIVLAQEEKLACNTPKKKDDWLKKIYRKIVSSTHPDKFVNFSVENLKEKYLKIYQKTVLSWERGEDDQILLCAYESDVAITNPKALPILEKGNKQKNARIKEIQTLLAYQWYHVPESDRSKTLENYLRKLGYSFTTEEVEKVVYLARKRKVGTRPKKLRNLKKGKK